MKNLILSLILLCIGALSYAQTPTLFENNSLTPSQLSEDQQAFVNRAILKYEALNTSIITVSNIETVQQNGILSFTLPSGEELTAYVLRVNAGEENTFTWTGKIGENGDFISLAQNAGGTGGMIKYQDRFYSIHPLDAHNALFVESDRSVHEDIVCGMDTQLGTTAFADEECSESECDGPVIDVLLVWTDEASQWLLDLGNPFVIAIYGMLGIESINIAFANSGISGEVRHRSFRYSGFSYDAQNEIVDDVITLANDPVILAARKSPEQILSSCLPIKLISILFPVAKPLEESMRLDREAIMRLPSSKFLFLFLQDGHWPMKWGIFLAHVITGLVMAEMMILIFAHMHGDLQAIQAMKTERF